MRGEILGDDFLGFSWSFLPPASSGGGGGGGGGARQEGEEHGQRIQTREEEEAGEKPAGRRRTPWVSAQATGTTTMGEKPSHR